MAAKVIYFDQVYGEFKQVLEQQKPDGFELSYWAEMSGEERFALLPEADFLLVAVHKLGEEILGKAGKAKLVQKTGIGLDNIDLPAATKHGLPVANTPGGNAPGVAELTILFTLALYRKLLVLNEATKKGEWLMWELRLQSFEMYGKTHGFVGFGNIGKEVAKRSQAFGTNVVYYDKFRMPPEQEKALGVTYMAMEDVLATADIVSLHLPLLDETRNLIGERELSLMKSSALLINVSRGNIVNETALYDALKAGRIAGAGIDVWAQEPVNPDNPLLTLDNVMATPHIGAGTKDTLQRVLHVAFTNMDRVRRGEAPQFVANPAVFK